MRREGREAHRDRLLVADVDEDLVEDGQRRLVRRRAQAALVEDGREPERLQGHGLAAGVRPADHERAQRAELEVDRDRRGPVEQRVARPEQHDFVALSHERAPPAAREAAAGDGEVERCGGVDERHERLGLCGDERREVAQDPGDLVALGDLGLAQAVRVVDRRQRLDEQRLARAGGVVNDAGHAPPGRGLQRQDGAAAALGDEVVLEMLGDRRVVRDLAQALGQPPPALAQLAAQAAQRRRGRVLQIGAVLLDRPPDLLGHGEQRRVDPCHELHQHRDLAPLAERAARRHPGANRALDLRQRASVERAAAGREVGRLAHVGCAAEVGLGRLVEQRDRLGRLLLAAAATSSASADGRRASASRAPGSLAAAPASRASTAGSSSSSRSCSRMGRVYGRAACCIPSRRVLRSRVVRYRNALPQLDGTLLLTDGGMETSLSSTTASSCRASPRSRCSSSEEGRMAMARYFEPYLDVARRHGTGFVLEANTWRANPSWGAQLGYSLDELAEANRRCIALRRGDPRTRGGTGPPRS